MGFIVLILGLALWTAAHFFKRLAPAQRAAMGDKGKAVVAVGVVAGLVLMILGYQWAAFINVWYPPAFFTHINNLLMLLAFYSYGIGAAKGKLAQRIRHPQLIAVKTWAIAHLLVNGDLASIILFGGLLAWAVGSAILINKSESWTPPAEIKPKGDLKLIVIALVLYAVVAGVHVWLGVNPFG